MRRNLSSKLISEILLNVGHDFLREHFWVFILLFQQALAGIVGGKIEHDHVKILKLENYETCSMLNVLIINNSQMTLLLRHVLIIPQTKLTISCEETNINSNSKCGLRIT